MKAPNFWYFEKTHPVNLIFWIPSFICSVLVLSRRILLKHRVINFPSVGVGSLSLGGAGKTTMSLKVAQLLKKNNLNPVIVHSGFGGKKEGYFPLGYEDVEGISDEVVMFLKRNFPAAAFRKREKAVEVLKDISDVLIFDDFFSHLIEPDVKILVFTKESIGNTLVFPFGPMREPLASVLWSDIILLEKGTKTSFVRAVQKFRRRTFFFSSKIKGFLFSEGNKISEIGPDDLRGRKAILISAIAIPSRFSNMIRSTGIEVFEHFILPDHSHISPDIIKKVGEKIQDRSLCVVITTEKDFWKLVGKANYPFYGARIDFEIDDDKQFEERLLCLLPYRPTTDKSKTNQF